MSANVNWIRVNKKHPCGVCGRVDWCGYTDGASICMRVESDKVTRNGGWLHKTEGFIPQTYTPQKKFVIDPLQFDAKGMFERWQQQTDGFHVDGFAMSLGVDTDALQSIGCAWSGSAWAFPMRNENSEITGIRLRGEDGRKWAVKGSKSGLFISDVPTQKTVYIVEGPTDAAATLTLGLYAIGRPACLGLEETAAKFIRVRGINRAVIISDNDEAGLRGSAKLQNALPVLSCRVVLPSKDIREFVNIGGTKTDIENIIKDMVWQRR